MTERKWIEDPAPPGGCWKEEEEEDNHEETRFSKPQLPPFAV